MVNKFSGKRRQALRKPAILFCIQQDYRPMRAVIYARYSSDNQRDASILDQVRLRKERVAQEGWELLEVYRNAAISGATTLRPGYQALLKGARTAAFEVGRCRNT